MWAYDFLTCKWTKLSAPYERYYDQAEDECSRHQYYQHDCLMSLQDNRLLLVIKHKYYIYNIDDDQWINLFDELPRIPQLYNSDYSLCKSKWLLFRNTVFIMRVIRKIGYFHFTLLSVSVSDIHKNMPIDAIKLLWQMDDQNHLYYWLCR